MERSIKVIKRKLEQIRQPENEEDEKEVFRVIGNIRKIFAIVMLVGVRCPKVAALFDHDTRAPFLCLLPTAEALKIRAITGDGIAQHIAIIRSQLIHIMYTLKAVGYWVEGKNLESENYDVGEFLQIIRQSCGKTSDLIVDVECDVGIHSRFHDGTMAMILINCVRNARKHGAASKMLIKCVKNCENVMIEVSDNGCGVNDNLNDNIFDWGVTGNPPDGTGIGLADAHARMAEMGGTIRFEHHGGLANKKNGSGAKFILTLPLVEVADY